MNRVDESVFRLHRLAEPERLPRYLPDPEHERHERLEAYARSRLSATGPNEQLALACFFVLRHPDLRAGECVYLTVGDLDLEGQCLLVAMAAIERRQLPLSNVPELVNHWSALAALRLPCSQRPIWSQPLRHNSL